MKFFMKIQKTKSNSNKFWKLFKATSETSSTLNTDHYMWHTIQEGEQAGSKNMARSRYGTEEDPTRFTEREVDKLLALTTVQNRILRFRNEPAGNIKLIKPKIPQDENKFLLVSNLS